MNSINVCDDHNAYPNINGFMTFVSLLSHIIGVQPLSTIVCYYNRHFLVVDTYSGALQLPFKLANCIIMLLAACQALCALCSFMFIVNDINFSICIYLLF